jgi:CrcB protein
VLKLLLLALAGGAGTLLRYGIQVIVPRGRLGFPYGTLAVNLLGCFLFGLIWTLAEGRVAMSATTRTVVLVGFLGGFTTFSSFAFETGQLVLSSQLVLAGVNLLAHNALGLVCLVVGMLVARLL